MGATLRFLVCDYLDQKWWKFAIRTDSLQKNIASINFAGMFIYVLEDATPLNPKCLGMYVYHPIGFSNHRYEI